ncbi:hypothetical protein B0H14DRAFT_3126983, partial [Mycena olivaceomarginata]
MVLPIGVFSFVNLPSPKMLQLRVVHQVFMLATELAVSVVMIIRVYALFGRSARVLWWLIGIAACLTGLTVGSANMDILSPYYRDAIYSSFDPRSCFSDLAVAWVCLFAFIFGLTVYNGYLNRRAVGPDQAMPIHQMVRD